MRSRGLAASTVSACSLGARLRVNGRITSNAAGDKPRIAPNYLSTSEDREVAADAIRVTRKLMKQHALEKYHPNEYLPGPSIGDDDASLAKAAGDIGTTIFHPVGTAKMRMATDPLAVVDERLRFHGNKGLPVLEAAATPPITAGTPTPPVHVREEWGQGGCGCFRWPAGLPGRKPQVACPGSESAARQEGE